MKDPFKTPFKLKESHLSQRVFVAILGPAAADTTVLVATPADWPKNIEDARDDLARCTKCLVRVWLAPSSVEVVAEGALIVCGTCLARQLQV